MSTLRIAINPEHKDFLETKYECKSNQFKSDIGFDLFLPEDVSIQPFDTKFINLGIRCEYVSSSGVYYGYHLYPRSSISKTKVRLANSVGIIDPNYRGYLIAAVDNISNEVQTLKKGERYFQLVFVKMENPKYLEFTDKLSETDRGAGGFGSTGK
jgi:dUTP pyrophosphatase